MDTNFQLCKKLLDFHPNKLGILSAAEVEKIEETLCLNEMDVLQLRNLRDFAVMYYSGHSENAEESNEKTRFMDIMSGVVSVIDCHVVKQGAEV